MLHLYHNDVHFDTRTDQNAALGCKLFVWFAACGCTSFGAVPTQLAQYAEAARMVVLQPCTGGTFDPRKYPNANEVC